MNIDKTYQFLNFIVNKTQSGPITPAQFNLIAQRSQIDFYNSDYKIFQETRVVSDELSPFIVAAIVNPDAAGQVSYPSDYVHVAGIRHLYYKNNVAIPVPVREVSSNELGELLMSQVAPATNKYPAMCYYDTYMQFAPKNLKAIQFDYLRSPAIPVWAYTVVNNRPVYDAANSVDLEVKDQYQNEIVAMMASYYGINISSAMVVQYAQEMKAETNGN